MNFIGAAGLGRLTMHTMVRPASSALTAGAARPFSGLALAGMARSSRNAAARPPVRLLRRADTPNSAAGRAVLKRLFASAPKNGGSGGMKGAKDQAKAAVDSFGAQMNATKEKAAAAAAQVNAAKEALAARTAQLSAQKEAFMKWGSNLNSAATGKRLGAVLRVKSAGLGLFKAYGAATGGVQAAAGRGMWTEGLAVTQTTCHGSSRAAPPLYSYLPCPHARSRISPPLRLDRMRSHCRPGAVSRAPVLPCSGTAH
eukprot:SAG22_NODE_29_length_28404_cov_23.294153_9_plen_256_part_00